MLDDLQEIVLAIFEDHEDALVNQYNLNEVDHIRMR